MNTRPEQASKDTSGLTLQVALQRQDFRLEIDLELAGHGITALFGPSGSGKTTALRVLAGLEPAAQGRVCVQGDVWQDSAQGVFKPVHQRALGYVFQEASLFDHLNVQENLQYGFKRTPASERFRNWDHTLDLLGIAHLLKRWPHELSGGERQRVAIARALAASPRLLLLDEPLAALDAPRKAEILPYLERLQSRLEIPVIYVTHAIDEVARLADQLVLLEAGQVTAHGPTAELLTRLDLPLAHGDSAGAVLHCSVVSHDEADHLTLTRFAGIDLVVPRQNAAVGQTLRVRVAARDASLTLQRQTDTSILNILPASVLALSPDGPGQVMVALEVGGSALLARITARSAHTLGLVPGLAVYAQIKGVAILG
ncbi:molybdenum ABC transporter ATP-binding protein [Rhodoferax ferrireducens]|uniref:molybdenum ABC transporter ATP-binding protein n=1 Tax=Rhodoferax ferrireducens TaxID=192843 RepID=UPI00298DA7CC|nr:molybdenum ABC transporter ATP-binding protein [Rhodoferax ferrireducens]WPC65708.1 molybdenum ABC transporter ATP-binding protein [Rhodoferax ferrireducens]